VLGSQFLNLLLLLLDDLVLQQQKEIEALKARLSQVDALTARLDALEKTAANK
jgi:hypothetical protein